MRIKSFPNLELNGRTIDEYETDCFGISQEELDNESLLFTYASFEDNDKSLTDNQLYRLSRKYPSVVYLLTYHLLSEDSPLHKRFANDPIVIEYLREDNLWTDEEFFEHMREQFRVEKIDISIPISEFLDSIA